MRFCFTEFTIKSLKDKVKEYEDRMEANAQVRWSKILVNVEQIL